MLLTLARHERHVSSMTTEFALCFEGRLAERLRDTGGQVAMLAPVRFSRPGSIVRARRALAELLASTGATVAVVHSSWIAALFGDLIARSPLGRVSWVHAPDRGPAWQRWPADRYRPQLLICNSAYTARAMPATAARVEICRYPVDPGPVTDRQARRGEAAGDAVILIAARMERWKGHRLLIEALGRLDGVPGWQCWVVGGAQNPSEAAYERSLHALARVRGIQHRLRWLGQREDVPSLLAAADVYCQPNEGPEPFGISFVEALNAGLPVVTTAIGAAPEIVDGACGVLVPPADPEQLSAALAALIRDGGRRARLAAAAAARAADLCAPARQIPMLQRLLAVAAPTPALAHA